MKKMKCMTCKEDSEHKKEVKKIKVILSNPRLEVKGKIVDNYVENLLNLGNKE